MRTIKKKLEPNINILCSNCERITPHFLNDCGEYKCSICQTVNKTVKIKTVEFVPDDNFIEEDKEEIEETESPVDSNTEEFVPIGSRPDAE